MAISIQAWSLRSEEWMRLHRGKVLYGEMEGSRTEPWRTSSFRRQARGREGHGRKRKNREKNQEKQIHFKFLP